MWRRLRVDERGEVTATVILVPVVLILVMVVIQAGLTFHARSVVTAAATDAARTIQAEAGTEQDGRAVADQLLAGSAGLLVDPQVDVLAGGGEVEVVITAKVSSLVPFWDPTVQGRASGPIEQFRPEGSR